MLDFRNTFNSVRRDKMLRAVQDLVPSIYPFLHSVYSSPSSLFWDNRTLSSSEGVQQGDPLGPLLFCLAIYHHSTLLPAVEYSDDITLGGSTEEILHNLESFAKIGLTLNNQKSEIICNDPVTRGTIIIAMPGACVVESLRATLLGYPIGNACCISDVLKDKINALEVMGDSCSTSQCMMASSSSETHFLSPNSSTPSEPPPVSSPPISVLTMFCSSPSSAM